MAKEADIVQFRAQRARGISYIAAAAPAAAVAWMAIYWLAPALNGMDDLGARMLFTMKCWAVSVLLCLVTGVEAVAHERLASPAFDPLSGYETHRMRVNLRYLQNTLEQIVVFTAGLFGLAAYASNGAGMRAVVATTAVWILCRFAFWLGYHRSAAARGLGAPGVAMSLLVLIYVVGRFGYEVAGAAGAVVPLALFAAIEGVLFWTTSRPSQNTAR